MKFKRSMRFLHPHFLHFESTSNEPIHSYRRNDNRAHHQKIYAEEAACKAAFLRHGRRVSTTLRQVLTKFSEFFMCWVFHKEISRQDRLTTTIVNSVDPQHPRFFCFIYQFPQAAVPDWKPAC